MSAKPFIFYLIDTPTGLAWYQDASGNWQKGNIATNPKINLPNAPGGWMQAALSYGRSATYYGLNQSYSIPMEFVKSSAALIRNQFYSGAGIECQMTLLAFVYNADPAAGEGTYELYYNGQLDFPKLLDKASESVKVNMIQTGLPALLNAFQDTVFEIPVDGSIPENVKVNDDGLLVPDTFFYTIIGVSLPLYNDNTGLYAYAIPCNFTNDLGDNFGMIKGSPTYDDVGIVGGSNAGLTPYTNYVENSGNTIIGSVNAKTYQVSGSITTTGSSNARDSGYVPAFDLVLVPKLPYVDYNNPAVYLLKHAVTETIGDTFTFSATVTLPENVQMFLMVYERPYSKITIKSGAINFSFVSSANNARIWGITLYDLGAKLVEKINQAASTTNQQFNYGFSSNLLKQYLGLIATSGDAIRAAGNPDYYKYFNAVQLNPNYPSTIVGYTYGPVIKTSLKEWFKACSAILCGALGVQKLAGQGETIFFEAMEYVFNPTLDPTQIIMLPEVANVEISPDEALLFKKWRIGYEPPSFDQQSGKYEYNTTLELFSPLKSINGDATLDIICPYCTSSYLIQRLLANISDTSTTRNDSDNKTFIISCDRTKSSPDYFDASFESEGDQTFDNTSNSNYPIIPALACQNLATDLFDGNFLSINSDSSIFVFNQPTPGTRSLALSVTGTLAGNVANALLGTPADYVTLTLYKNGAVYATLTVTKTGTGPTDAINFVVNTASLVINQKDCFYLRATTSPGATVVINGGSSLIIGAGYFAVYTDSAITIQGGAVLQMVPFTNTAGISNVTINGVPRPVASYGFQYFIYNNYQALNNYNYAFTAHGITKNNTGSDNLSFDLYYNGAIKASANYPGTTLIGAELPFNPSGAPSISGNQQLALGDLFFVLANNTNQLAQITYMDFNLESTQITAYGLLRELYDSITGVPTLVASDQPGAAFNIEPLTPARMARAWMPYINGILYAQFGSYLQFSKLDKNQYLSTTKGSTIITENANIEIGTNGSPLFYALRAKYQTKVPWNFNQLFLDTANRHIAAPYNGINIYNFPMDVRQVNPLNEMQTWDGRISAATNLMDLIDLEITGLKNITMSPNSIFNTKLNPVQFVPQSQVVDPRYHTFDIGSALYYQQVGNWVQKANYYQPWMQADTINLQFRTRDLSSVSVQLITCSGSVISTTAFTLKSSSAIISPYNLFEASIPLATITPGQYYLLVTAGTGGNQAVLISEGLDIQVDQPQTMLIEYSNSLNKQSMVFDTGFSPNIRVAGFFDNMLQPEFKGSMYIDELQDASIINAINYETRELWIGLGFGVPDFMIQKIARILTLDTWTLDGTGYSLDEGAKFEKQFTPGAPMKYWKVQIRLAENTDGQSVVATGADADASMMVTLDAQYFGPNAGSGGDGTSIITEVTIS